MGHPRKGLQLPQPVKGRQEGVHAPIGRDCHQAFIVVAHNLAKLSQIEDMSQVHLEAAMQPRNN